MEEMKEKRKKKVTVFGRINNKINVYSKMFLV